MCGRFAIFSKPDEYIQQLGLEAPSSSCPVVANYNAYPTQSLPVLYRDHENALRCELSHWGLIPSWAKDDSIGFKTSNARSETAAEKPSFKHAFKKQRCLIPVDGWYEWKRDGKNKQPYYHYQDQQVTWLAGLWENWTDPRTGKPLHSFTILTQDAKGKARKIHNRMPVFLNSENAENWLDSQLIDTQHVYALMQYLPESDFNIFPVSKTMNSPKINNPSCIKPVDLNL